MLSVRARILVALAAATAFMLSACDSPGGSGGAGGAADAAADNLSAEIGPEAAARLRAQAETALAGLIPSPASALYANLRSGSAGSVCGEVGGGAEAGLRPFVVTPDGIAMVSASPTIRLEDPTDPFPDLYMRYCASAEELRLMEERMNRLGLPPPSTPPPPDAASPPRPADQEEPGDEAEEARPRTDESFFNAVVRPPRPAAPPR